MIKGIDVDNSNVSVLTLQPPEVLETRHTPMFMCCGYWSYSISGGLAGPTLTVTWTDDSSAPCN